MLVLLNVFMFQPKSIPFLKKMIIIVGGGGGILKSLQFKFTDLYI